MNKNTHWKKKTTLLIEVRKILRIKIDQIKIRIPMKIKVKVMSMKEKKLYK